MAKRTDSWKGKTAVVCGASAGLGRCLAETLAETGVRNLALVARGQDALEELQLNLSAQFTEPSISSFAGDLVDRDQSRRLGEQINQQLGPVDLLVQAVGQSDRGQVLDLTAERVSQLLQLNLVSSLNAVQAFEPAMTRPGGTIVLIGSLASLFAPRFLGGYALAKHALAALAQQARLELRDAGIHVMLACPGPIQRSDAGDRYAHAPASDSVPEQALQPGGGAQLSGLDPQKLARDILRAASRRTSTLVRPRSARFLWALSGCWPALAEKILRSKTS